MSILTKNQLSASNAASFPDNNSQLITPQVLRSFNTSIIDSMVDSLDTGSFARTDISNTFTAANTFTDISASGFISASSFVGNGSKITGITASVALPILDEGVLQGYATSINFTGSAINAQVIAGTAVVSVNVEGAGFVSTSSFNAYTSSNDSKVNSLINATGSYAISASVAAVDAAQQAQINSLIASTASFTSLNQFTQSQETKDATLATYTASVDEKFSNIGGQSGSWDNTSLNAFSASQLTKDSTLATYTASVDQKFSNIGSQSGSWITESETGSFATTGSNTFNGNQNIVGNITASGALRGDQVYITGNGDARFYSPTNGNVVIENLAGIPNTTIQLSANTTVVESLSGTGNLQIGSITASLQQGYVWVGNSIDKTTLVPTSSFAGTPTDITSLNAFTASQDTKNSTLANVTASLNASTASQQSQIDNLIAATGSYITTPLTSLNSFTASQLDINTGYNTFTSSANQRLTSIESVSGSWITESETASFARTDVDNNFTANQTFTNITAVSASFTYVQTTYETSSIIYSSGSNQFGDELSDIQTLSGSVKVQGSLTVNGTPVQTSSVDITSLNAFTASQETKNSTLATYTQSVDSSLTNINSFTASNGNTSLNAYTQSNDTKWSNLAGQTGSYVTSAITASSLVTASVSLNTITFTKGDASTFNITVDTGSAVTTDLTSLNAFTASQETKDTTLASVTSSLNSATASLFTSTSLSLITASAVGNTITFTKGDASTFNVSVASTPIDTGSFATTASFNSYTSSNDQRVSSLETNSASVNISISNINTATASLFTSASLSLVTASFSGNTLTFTKGDTTTFGVVIPDVSGSAGTTVIEVVYTGESITKGDPLYISGSQGANPIVFKADASNPAKMPVTFISNETIGAANTTEAIVLGLIEGIDLTGYVAGQSIYVAEGGGYSTNLPSGSNSITQLLGVITKEGPGGKGLVLNPGPAQLPGLDTGYMWVGGSTNQPIEITTASFASSASFNSYTSSTDSRLTNIEATTASLNTSVAALNTFTQSQDTKNTTLGNLTGSFATTGSNSFNGIQSISGSFNLTGSAFGNVVSMSVTSNTASMDFNLGNYFELSASVSPIRIEVSNLKGGVTSTLALNGVTSSTINFSSNVLQPSGSAYTASVSGSNDILSFVAFNSNRVNVVSTLKMI
jgi:hypothetical protein